MNFADVTTPADLLAATRAAAGRCGLEGRKLDSAVLFRELAEADAVAQRAGHLDRHHLLARLSAACPTALAVAEQFNLSSDSGFIHAACAALQSTKGK